MSSPAPRRRRTVIEDIGSVTVVHFVDRRIFDEYQGHQALGEDLHRVVDELGRRKVLLNFGNLEFMTSSAFGKVITLYRKLLAVRGKLVLCNIVPDILEVFKITKLDKLLHIVADPGLVSQDDVIAEVFGDPFKPVAFAPEWRTDTAVLLAKQMYDSRDFSVMPILADALQDAGCDSEDVLDHSRGPGPHVRGCWVVDLVLGKE